MQELATDYPRAAKARSLEVNQSASRLPHTTPERLVHTRARERRSRVYTPFRHACRRTTTLAHPPLHRGVALLRMTHCVTFDTGPAEGLAGEVR